MSDAAVTLTSKKDWSSTRVAPSTAFTVPTSASSSCITATASPGRYFAAARTSRKVIVGFPFATSYPAAGTGSESGRAMPGHRNRTYPGVRIPPVPSVYTWLGAHPGDYAVIELPIAAPGIDAWAMFWAANTHWPTPRSHSRSAPP